MSTRVSAEAGQIIRGGARSSGSARPRWRGQRRLALSDAADVVSSRGGTLVRERLASRCPFRRRDLASCAFRAASWGRLPAVIRCAHGDGRSRGGLGRADRELRDDQARRCGGGAGRGQAGAGLRRRRSTRSRPRTRSRSSGPRPVGCSWRRMPGWSRPCARCWAHDDYAGAGRLAGDWTDPDGRAAAVDRLARDGTALLAALRGRQVSDTVVQAAQLLATVTGQDLEQGPWGPWRSHARAGSVATRATSRLIRTPSSSPTPSSVRSTPGTGP